MLDEEEREDCAMKDRFKQKWKRTESSKLTESLRAEVAKFQGIVETATKVACSVKNVSFVLISLSFFLSRWFVG